MGSVAFGRPVDHNSGTSEHGSIGALHLGFTLTEAGEGTRSKIMYLPAQKVFFFFFLPVDILIFPQPRPFMLTCMISPEE